MSGNWTISELQLPLTFNDPITSKRVEIPFQHNYFVVRDEYGTIQREFNGLALSATGRPLTIGTFGEPLRVWSRPYLGDSQAINETVLSRASKEEILTRVRAVEICAQMIDESDVTYQVTGRNSNSIASTIAACFGLVEPAIYIGLSTPGANNILLSPEKIIQAQIRAGFDARPRISNNRCFVSGTTILMKGNRHKPIEQICPGDEVLAFNSQSNTLPLEHRRVSRVFVNQANIIIDLRGLRCTPGHVFLTGDIDAQDHGKFATIARILRNDKTIVEQDSTIIRARTGARLGTDNDALVAVVYRDHPTAGMPGVERRALVRAGIQMPPTILADGLTAAPTGTLAGHLAAYGITVLPDSSLRTPDGRQHAACNWPEGSTPFDTHESRNWIVEADGQPYTPPWIRDLVEEDEHQGLRVVGALPTAGGTAAPPRPL